MGDAFDVEADPYDGIDLGALTADELDSVAVDTVNEWQDNMNDAGYRNTGDTINSITWEAPEPLVRRVGSDRIAALIGELGRPPGAGHPPPDELGDWVHEQADLPSRGETVKWEFNGETREVSFDQVVFLIGRSINEEGLPAHHFGRRAAQTVASDLGERVGDRIDRDLEDQSSE